MAYSKSIPPALLAALHRVEPNATFFQSPASSSQVQSSSTNKTYFAKLGSAMASDVEQYHGEAESLRAMYEASPGICPRVFESFVDPTSKSPVFVSEHKNIGPFNERSAVALASALAEMHIKGKSPAGQFGFAVPTYCGQTRMSNGWSQTWAEAFDKMIGDLLDKLKCDGSYDEICALGQEVRARWVDLYSAAVTRTRSSEVRFVALQSHTTSSWSTRHQTCIASWRPLGESVSALVRRRTIVNTAWHPHDTTCTERECGNRHGYGETGYI